MSTENSAPPPPATPGPVPIAGVLALTQAITAEATNPIVTEAVATALQRLTTVQSLATAIQDAVNDLRAHTTAQLAATGAAAAKLVETGDVELWKKTVAALQLATAQSEQRLARLIAHAQGHASPAKP